MKNILPFFIALILTVGIRSNSSAQCPISNACTPGNATNAQAGLFGGGIFQVKLGPTFVNSSAGASEGYKDNCSLGAVSVSLGLPTSIYVKTGTIFSENLRAYLDLNNDQSFDPVTELVFTSNNSKVHTGFINVPSGTTGQQLKLRITSDLITSTALPTPCSTPEYSQVEDYAIILQQNVNPPVAAFNVSDTLTCSGNVTFTDQSINNPTSWFWSFGDGQTSTQQNPAHQYQNAGLFSVKLKVSNANGLDSITKNNLIRYNDSVPALASCAPITFNQCCGYGISRFKFNTIDNSSTLGTYQNFSCTQRTTVLQGRNYTVNISTNPNQNQDTRIWIDYNNNGVFEASEKVFESLNSINPTGEIIISNDTSILKNRPLRLRVMSEFAGGAFGPCTDLDKGQCEDYTLYIKENFQPPVANFNVASANFCQSLYTFNSTSLNVIAFYHWYFGDGTDTVTIEPIVNHNYSSTGSFSVKLEAVGPFGTDTLLRKNVVNYFGPPVTACTSTTQVGGPQAGTGIAEVKFGSIFKRSGNSSEGYQNFTCSNQTSVLVGQVVPITIRNSAEQSQVEKVKVWIDWNANGTLENSELVLNVQNDTVHTGNITIPATATLNTTLRMRVSSNFQNAGQINACGNIQLGQSEDYGVVVLANSVKPTTYFKADKLTSCTGIVQFTDSTLNLPDSYLWKFGDGTTSTQKSPAHSYSSTGSFTVTLVTSNAFGTDSVVKTNYIQVTNTTGMVATNCAPVATSYCCQFGISQVTFAGINQSSGDASEGYKDFTCGTIGSAGIGSSQPITITNSGGNLENVGVWVDWNNDGTFSDAELAFSSTSSTTHSGNITIPGNAPAGLGLRVRVKSDISALPVGTACGTLQSGQVEDYQIVLQGNNQAPIALFSASSLISCDGIISFSDTSFNAPTSWKWKFGDGDSSSSRNPIHTYTAPGTYTVSLIVSNLNGADTLIKSAYVKVNEGKNLKPAPCKPTTNNTANNQGLGIRQVVFNTINRQSPTAPTELYFDASCTNRTNLISGQSYTITVSTSTTFAESCRAWIDWNNNGQFEDPAERVLNGTNAQVHTANVAIPTTAKTDTALRMRVMSDFGGGGPGGNNIQPCNNLNFGQCEDYAVVVQANTTAPDAKISSASRVTCNGFIQFRDSSNFVPTSWLWRFGDGQTSTQKNPLYKYQAIGQYSVTLKVFNAFGADSTTFTNYITVTGTSGPVLPTCVNTVTAPGATVGTTRVQFGSLDKTSGLAGADGGYLDYTCSDSAVIVIASPTQTNPLVINTSAGQTRENVRVYIDYNNDGIFANNESVFNSQNNNIHSANLTITQAQCLGVKVRMRVITDIRFNQITNSCYNSQQGQIEDYTVKLIWQPNTTPPDAVIASINAVTCNGYVQFRDSSGFFPTAWLWSFGDGQTSTQKNPLHKYQSSGQYTVKLKATNNFGSDSITLPNFVTIGSTSGPRPPICINTVANPGTTLGTTLVQFGTLDKTSGLAAQDGGYLDYTCSDSSIISVETATQTNTLTINTSAGNTTENCRVYIDFNNDGQFGNTESVLNSLNNTVHTANLTFTQAQCLGVNVRMRVITDTRFNQITNSCYNSQQGQIEDYSVKLIWVTGNESLSKVEGLKIFPNPTQGWVTLSTEPGSGDKNWSLFDLNGRSVASGNVSEVNDQTKLDFRSLPNGLYHLNVQSRNGSVHQKIIIQK